MKEYYAEPWEIYNLARSKKLKPVELLIDTFIVPEFGPVSTADGLSDLSPYYWVKKDNLKLLVNIKDWTLTAIELPSNTNDKKFTYETNMFINVGRVKLR